MIGFIVVAIIIVATIVNTYALLVSLINLWGKSELTAVPVVPADRTNSIKLAILIPARNEEHNIGSLLDSISRNLTQLQRQAQQDPKVQPGANTRPEGDLQISIHVLDDNSSDNTAKVVESYKNSLPNLYLHNGQPLPNSWLGKNWACQQLSEKLTLEKANHNNDYLLFLDADVTLAPGALASAIAEMERHSGIGSGSGNNIDLLSIFPRQICRTKGEKLVIPYMHWLLISFLPLPLANATKFPPLSAANGQFMLWRKQAYLDLGGHRAVKSEIVEDVALIKLAKSSGQKAITLLGRDLINCRMYPNFSSAFTGFSKNAQRQLTTNSAIFALILLGIFSARVLTPVFGIILIGLHISGIDSQPSIILGLAIANLTLVAVNLSIAKALSRAPVIDIAFHPLQVAIQFIIGINSISLNFGRSTEWKGRKVN